MRYTKDLHDFLNSMLGNAFPNDWKQQIQQWELNPKNPSINLKTWMKDSILYTCKGFFEIEIFLEKHPSGKGYEIEMVSVNYFLDKDNEVDRELFKFTGRTRWHLLDRIKNFCEHQVKIWDEELEVA